MTNSQKYEEYLEPTGESNVNLDYLNSKKGLIINFIEYKNSKNSILITEHSNKDFIKDNKVSINEFFINNEENILIRLEEYLVKNGCKDITQKLIPKWKTDFEKDVTLVSAKYRAKSKKDIDKFRIDIFNKFPLGEEGILLKITKD